MRKVLSQVAGAGVGLWLATMFVPGVRVVLLPDSNFFGIAFTALWQVFLLLGIALGLLNYFIKPVLKILALPLEILTLGLFSIVISMAMIWVIDIIFEELSAPPLMPLLWTSIFIWISNFIISKIINKED